MCTICGADTVAIELDRPLDQAAKIEVIRSYPDTKMQQLQTEHTADFVGDWMMAAAPKNPQFALSIHRNAKGELKAQFRASEPGSGKSEDGADVAVNDRDGIGRLIWKSSPDKDDIEESYLYFEIGIIDNFNSHTSFLDPSKFIS